MGTNQIPKPLSIVRGISNKERGKTHEKMPSLKEPSIIVTKCFKIKIVYVRCNATNTLCL
jgi:hypothetical protein